LKKYPENDYVFPNEESFLIVLQRLKDFLNDVNTKYSVKKILVVSNGFPCETLLDWVANKPISHWNSCIQKGKVFHYDSGLPIRSLFYQFIKYCSTRFSSLFIP
tara:strand:+ start:8279 stop:8590 length:312 start_codon:yes stop_codon:yes gene_type:complete